MNAEGYKNLGNKEYTAGNYQKAVDYYTDAVELDSKNHFYWTNRSAAYAALKKWDKSLKDADAAVALKPDWTKVGTPRAKLHHHSPHFWLL